MTTKIEIKFKQPVLFNIFVEKEIESGQVTDQLRNHLERLLGEWQTYNKGCFEKRAETV